MTNVIKLEIPLDDPEALNAMGRCLSELATAIVGQPASEYENDLPETVDDEKPTVPTTPKPDVTPEKKTEVPDVPTEKPPVEPTKKPGVKLDSEGRPWDKRIHSPGKKFVVKGEREGQWIYKRLVDKLNLVPEVEAELDALMGAEVPPATDVVPDVPAETDEVPDVPPATTDENMTFGGLTVKVNELVGNGFITLDQVNEVIASITGGIVKSMPLLINRKDYIPAVSAGIDELL